MGEAAVMDSEALSSLVKSVEQVDGPDGQVETSLLKDRVEICYKLILHIRRTAEVDLIGASVAFGVSKAVLESLRALSESQIAKLALDAAGNMRLTLEPGMVEPLTKGQPSNPLDVVRAYAAALCGGSR